MRWFDLFKQKKSTGLIPQPVDNRDYEYIPKKVASSNDGIDLRWAFPKVTQQGSWNSCAAHAVCALLDYSLKYKKQFTSWDVNTSEVYLWYYARKRLGEEKQNTGTILRDYFKVLNENGFSTENRWSYSNNVYEEPSIVAMINAEIHKKYLVQLKGYYAFTPGKLLHSKLKNALDNGYPVVFGMPVDDDYMKLRGDGYVSEIKDSANYHAQIIVGYKQMDAVRYYIVRNSWGSTWGDNGYSYVEDTIIGEKGFDFWTLM
jgi:C1A family cysteine protease